MDFGRGSDQYLLLTRFVLREKIAHKFPSLKFATHELPCPVAGYFSQDSHKTLRSLISTASVFLQAQQCNQAAIMNGVRSAGLRILFVLAASACVSAIFRCAPNERRSAPQDIDAPFNQSAYAAAKWRLRAVDLDFGRGHRAGFLRTRQALRRCCDGIFKVAQPQPVGAAKR